MIYKADNLRLFFKGNDIQKIQNGHFATGHIIWDENESGATNFKNNKTIIIMHSNVKKMSNVELLWLLRKMIEPAARLAGGSAQCMDHHKYNKIITKLILDNLILLKSACKKIKLVCKCLNLK